MKPHLELDRVFPLSAGSSERARLRAPRLSAGFRFSPVGGIMSNHAFLRTWAVRRAQLARAAHPLPSGDASALPGPAAAE